MSDYRLFYYVQACRCVVQKYMHLEKRTTDAVHDMPGERVGRILKAGARMRSLLASGLRVEGLPPLVDTFSLAGAAVDHVSRD